ncbi:replication restart DNA helicase PriA [Paenibacillus sp. UNCCL117]|uniref:TFIIB-type zinc ribbon-containing protein n=1 Tax=unclassified Paenibacillus TaxID=185978 RepID=UPI000880F274|nr:MULTISPECIES: TFIIB-type zinc ribbon-containing protein [unclassified Paenibacillus]SDC44386.1 TFIIB zinc-binding [Paenibacillus sp. cl123]SFW12752.1 replication restart DNA helicase PriA [Paenibacillus sp. UNCCL117]
MQVIEYKCPNCGSSMVFDSATGMLSCHSCGRKDNIEQMPDPLAKQTFSEDEAQEYHCLSCGAVIITDAETTATVCSFCGSGVVLGDRLTGKLAPAKVIPFSIGKQEAIQAFKKWCRNGRLTPAGFMTADRIKSMTGMYVPFWLYNLDNHIEVQAQGTKVRVYTQGDYQITETQHFEVYRKIRLNYAKVPVDASEKMKDELMDKLEPFPYDQLKTFKTAYLAGFIAEKYNQTDEELLPRAKEKISDYIEAYIRSSMAGYTAVTYTGKHIDTRAKHTDYVLLPVWVVHYDYNKLEHTFAMNGQTGKVVGKPPISKGKVAAWFAGVSGCSLLSLKLISWMMGGGFW